MQPGASTTVHAYSIRNESGIADDTLRAVLCVLQSNFSLHGRLGIGLRTGGTGFFIVGPLQCVCKINNDPFGLTSSPL
jgi:hypothetical protein